MADAPYPIADPALAWFSEKERAILQSRALPAPKAAAPAPDRVAELVARLNAKQVELGRPVTP
jgi:hypothetical protein